MKKFLATGVLALAAATLSQQQASAWCNNSLSMGLSWTHQSGGNSLLWGAWRSYQPGEPTMRNVYKWPQQNCQTCQPGVPVPHFDHDHPPMTMAPVYAVPAPAHGVPAPVYGAPAPVYGVPAPVAVPAAPGYTVPAPTPVPAPAVIPPPAQNQTSYFYQGNTYYVPVSSYGR